MPTSARTANNCRAIIVGNFSKRGEGTGEKR
jgi:hypothetical protein